MTTTRVFVYGSLRQGFGNHKLLKKATLVGPSMTAEARFCMFDLGTFPGVMEDGNCWIHGETYEVDELTLARLDRLEGHPRFYERRQVRMIDGADAWMYILTPAYFNKNAGNWSTVYSGDWQLHQDERSER